MGPSENSKLRYCRQLELQKWQIAPLLVIRAPIEGGGGTTAVLWLLDYRPPNIHPHYTLTMMMMMKHHTVIAINDSPSTLLVR